MKIRRVLSVFLIMLFLFSALPIRVFARGAGGGFSGGSRGFGGSSSSSKGFGGGGWGSKPYSSPTTPSGSSGSGGGFFSSNKPSTPSGIDSKAQTLQQKADSRESLMASQQRSTAGSSDPLRPKQYRGPSMNYQGYSTRSERSGNVFKSYTTITERPLYAYGTYHDGFNPYFWMWLMDHNNDRDAWIYNHRDEIDPERMKELEKNDADLNGRLSALEAQGIKKDPTYVPVELKENEDLVYSDEVADKTYKDQHDSSMPWGFMLGLLLLLGGGYLLFFREFRVRV